MGGARYTCGRVPLLTESRLEIMLSLTSGHYKEEKIIMRLDDSHFYHLILQLC